MGDEAGPSLVSHAVYGATDPTGAYPEAAKHPAEVGQHIQMDENSRCLQEDPPGEYCFS